MRQLDAVVSYTNFAALITYGVCYESRKTERRKSLVKKSIERERAREREREVLTSYQPQSPQRKSERESSDWF